jgi:hypothetical protein
MVDLEAIRQRNEARKSAPADEYDRAQALTPASDDIDALLAEVERLRTIVDVLPDGPCTIKRKDGEIVAIFFGEPVPEWKPEIGDAQLFTPNSSARFGVPRWVSTDRPCGMPCAGPEMCHDCAPRPIPGFTHGAKDV